VRVKVGQGVQVLVIVGVSSLVADEVTVGVRVIVGVLVGVGVEVIGFLSTILQQI